MAQCHQAASGHGAGPACFLMGRGGMRQAGSCLLMGPPLFLPLQEIGSIIGKVRFGVQGTTSPGLPWT